MEGYPSISVVTPSYNQAQFLERTIESVLSQDYPGLEHIIIDGGSTDESVDIIRRYARHLAYWVSERDAGQADAVNKGFRRATGEIVGWLNSDDLYVPGTLQTIGAYFVEHPDVDFVYGDVRMIDRQGNLLFERKTIPYHHRMQLFGGCLIPQPAAFFRRSVLARVGELDVSLRYNLDVDFFIRCGEVGVKFGHIPQPLACFRLHPASKTQNQDQFARERRRLLAMRYVRGLSGKPTLDDALLRLLGWFYRGQIFVIRAVTRGDFLPFKEARVMRQLARPRGNVSS